MFQYFLEVSIAWAIFFLIYYGFLRKETFFSSNRWYLLNTIWIGLLLPVIRQVPYSINAQFAQVEPIEMLYSGTVNFVQLFEQPNPGVNLNLYSIILTIYLLGAVLCALRMIYGLLRINQLWNIGEKQHYEQFSLVRTNQDQLPFSFFKHVFVNRKFLKNASFQEILKHELTHVRLRHTFDILFLELISIAFWWDPIIYLYKRAIRTAHEYMADAFASGSEIKKYGHILLGQSSSGIELALTHQFFNSHLKKRLQMLHKEKSAPYRALKYLLVTPFIILLALLFSSNSYVEPAIASTTGDLEKSISGTEIEMLGLNDNKVYIGIDNKVELVSDPASNSIDLNSLDPEYAEVVKISNNQFSILPIKPMPRNKSLKLEATSEISSTIFECLIRRLPAIIHDTIPKKFNDELFKVVEEMPRFPGCEEESGGKKEKDDCGREKLLEYIGMNLKYPSEAREKGTEGMVVIQFVVEKNGTVGDIKILREIGDGCGEAGKKVVESMNQMDNRWNPGKQRGQLVRVVYTLPIKFKLPKGDSGHEDVPPPPPPPAPSHRGGEMPDAPSPPVAPEMKAPTPQSAPSPHSEPAPEPDAPSPPTPPSAPDFESHPPPPPPHAKIDGEKFMVVEQMPRFPGCENEKISNHKKEQCAKQKMLEYIYGNLSYPKEAKEQGVQGMVVLEFVVETDGAISNIEIVRDIGAGCGQAAFEVLNSMNDMGERWIPGKQRGKSVRVKYTIPVKFKAGVGNHKQKEK